VGEIVYPVICVLCKLMKCYVYVLLECNYISLHFKGGTVHLVCRNAERGKEAQEAIIKETKNDVRY